MHQAGLAPSSQEHLVVGAGVSGLYAALLLARSGKRVRVLERGPRPGGLAGAEHFRGVPCDLGSHRLHPDALAHPLFREIHRAEPLLARPRRGVLLLGARRLPYPPTAAALLRALGPRRSLELAYGLLCRRDRRRAFAAWDGDRGPRSPDADADADADVGFARFVRDRVGDAAYRAFYEPYAEKVWGIDPAALSQVVAKKRVSSAEPWKILRAFAGQAIARATGSAAEAIGDHFFYPARGISSIIDYLVDRLEELGVPIEIGRAYEPGHHPGPVLFAGDLGAIVPTALEHRGVYLVFMALPGARLGQAETYYAPERGYWFGRASELQNYSPALRPRGRAETILCVEIPEGAWGRGVDFASGRRLAALRDQLARAGIVPPEIAPLETHQRFVPGVYPLYRRGWLTEWRATMRRVARLGNVIPFGRQALFLHCNLDHCATIAADALAHLEAKRSPEAWIEQASAYLEIRVRD